MSDYIAIRTYKYLLKPSREQQAALHSMLRVACDLYNHALAHRRKRWQESRHTVTYVEQAKLLTLWRNEDRENNPLHALGVTAAQQVLRRLDRAYREFLRGTRGHPRFKPYRFFNSLNWPNGYGADLRRGCLRVHNVGLIPLRRYRPLPEGKLKNIVVKRTASGWWAFFQVEITLPEPSAHSGLAVGIDVGLHHALALSDGTVVDSPRYLRQSLKRLRVLQRRVSRRVKGSRRWRKACRDVARQHERVANQRRQWWHEVTRWLVENYGVVVLEDLNLSFMLRNGHLSRAAHDVGLGIFYELLAYKAIEAGSQVMFVDAAYTSQTCSGCGLIEPKKLSDRVHRCPACGLTLDRDVNAAKVILSRSGDRPSGANVEVVNSRVA